MDEEKGTCPKGVPIFSPQNYDAWSVFSVLLTQAVEPNTGIVKYDASLVKEMCDLFEVDESRRLGLAGRVLYLVSEMNEYRMDELRQRADRPSGGVPDVEPD